MPLGGLTAMLVCLSACGGDDGGADGGLDGGARDTGGPETGRLDAGPDLDSYCHWDCFGGFVCRDGGVYENAFMPVSCRDWTGACPSRLRSDIVCARGCRDFTYASRPEDVCAENVPKDVGDACSAAEHCTPGREVPDGFGSTVPLALDCDPATSMCVLRAVEECNGGDDDGDGTIDEGCTAKSVIVARIAVAGIALDVAFSPDRIALLGRDTLANPSLAIVSPDGSALSAHVDLLFARQVEREPGGWALLRHGSSGSIDELVRIRDDGTRTTLALTGAPRSRFVDFARFGASYLLLGLDELPDGVALSLHDRTTGARTASGTLTTMPGFGVVHAPLETDLLLLSASFGIPIDTFRVTPTLDVTSPSPATPGRRGMVGGLALHGGGYYAVVEDEHSGHVLVTLDALTGAWTDVMPLGMLMAPTWMWPTVIAADGDDLAVSWVDVDGMLRTLVLDATGARIGASIIEVGVPEGALWAGTTTAGARVVVPTSTGWLLVAPAVRRVP